MVECAKGGFMINKIHRATQTTINTKDFTNFAEATLFGDSVETLELWDCWTITVYKADVDGFKKGMMIEPVKEAVQNPQRAMLIIKEFEYTIQVTSFVSELHALQISKGLII